ncbi:hypothetical protein [Methanobacterium sp. ACI-7]|uniref:hypothetical protein n=1 Tax=unclassified Methanobacterium TaxID=2627676 RepID=UPI0039C199CA
MVEYKPIIAGMVFSLIFGLIIIFIPSLGLFTRLILGFSVMILGGLIAAYITDGTNKDGGVNGAMAAGFGGALLVVLLFSSDFDNVFETLTSIFTGLIVGFLVGMNFGIIGAVIGNMIKKNPQTLFEKSNGYLICNKCGGYYELKEGELPEDYDLNCECGGKIEYKKSLQSDIKFNFDRVFGLGVLLTIIGGILVICTIGGIDLGRGLRRIALGSFMIGIMIILAYYFESKGVDW